MAKAHPNKHSNKITKLMVANRGEIACRVFAACRTAGIKTFAVYSEADKAAKHVRTADQSECVGPGPAVESYLNISKLIEVAKKNGVDAIHPGYGFLSERSAFAKAVIDAGINWVGPTPEVIDLMGSKIAAKQTAEKAGVPTLPWALLKSSAGDKVSTDELKTAGKKVGYPLLLKASAGGGGRGMRVVQNESEIEEAAISAMREAAAAFGSGEIFLESYKTNARHVEVQILGDKHGQVFTFGERDCTAQRRHQKVLEEAPAPKLSQKTREALWSAAANLGRMVKYENAGTCEFLVDAQENFYFLEMNTRLQVEHPVTEEVWGVDLVQLQLAVARGEKLDPALGKLQPRGHAIEARIYAENPAKGFMPSPGKIKSIQYPSGPRIRVDFGYEPGDEVPIYYDAMIAKVISWGMDRETAIAALLESFEKMDVTGVTWNVDFLSAIAGHKDFTDFKIHTKWIESALKDWKPTPKTKSVDTKAGVEQNQAMATQQWISPWVFYGSTGAKLGSGSSSSAVDAEFEHAAHLGTSGPLTAEQPGKVLKVKVAAGDKVKEGQVLIVCESMKMEFSYTAPEAAKVKSVLVKEGQIVSAGATLLEWEES